MLRIRRVPQHSGLKGLQVLIYATCAAGVVSPAQGVAQAPTDMPGYQALSRQVSTLRASFESVLNDLRLRLERYENCSAIGRIYAPANQGADGNGCLSLATNVQVGEVNNPNYYAASNYDITFSPPYENIPEVVVAVKKFTYRDGSNGCPQPSLTVQAEAKNITRNGFTLHLDGGSYCGNYYGVHQAVWIALDNSE